MPNLPHIRQLLQSNHEETRHDALHTLRGVPLSASCDLLLLAMKDPSWRVRKESVDLFVSANPDETTIDQVLELLRDKDNAGARNSAAEAVARIGSQAAPCLCRLVSDRDEDVRKMVIDVMGLIGGAEFVPALLAALSDPDINVSSAAAEHLGNLGDESAVPALIKAVVDNTAVFFRFSALTALGKLNSHVAVPEEIIQLAEEDVLRKSVYDCLGSIGDEAVARILLEGALSRQKSSRSSAIISWHKIFTRSDIETRDKLQDELLNFKKADLLPVLVDSFDIHNTPLSEAITVILGMLGDIRGAETLLKAVSCERISRAALASLKRLGTNGIDLLLELYPGCDESGRCAICMVVGQVGDRQGDDIIRKGLQDPSNLVRFAALKVAGKMGLVDCIPSVVKLLDTQNPELHSTAISCLCSLAAFDQKAIQGVARQLEESEQPEQRSDAVALYAALKDSQRLAFLVKDENSTVRQAAVTAFGKQRIQADSSILLMALVDEDPEVRISAAEAIGFVGSSDSVPYLLLALEDEDSWVRCESLNSIARIAPERLFSVIQAVFENAKNSFLRRCLEQLERIGTIEALELIEKAVDSEDSETVALAISILVHQGQAWISSNSKRLVLHPKAQVRSAWVTALAELPADLAQQYLSDALKQADDLSLQNAIHSLLKGIC